MLHKLTVLMESASHGAIDKEEANSGIYLRFDSLYIRPPARFLSVFSLA